MLGSLMVHARRITGARARGRPLAEAGEGVDGAGSAQPPRAASQRGVVKWWKVTTGSMPAASSASPMRR